MKKKDITLALVFVHPYSVFYKTIEGKRTFIPTPELAKKSMEVWDMFNGVTRAVILSSKLDDIKYLEKHHLEGFPARAEPEYKKYYKRLKKKSNVFFSEDKRVNLFFEDSASIIKAFASFKEFVQGLKAKGIKHILFIGGTRPMYYRDPIDIELVYLVGCISNVMQSFSDFHRWVVSTTPH